MKYNAGDKAKVKSDLCEGWRDSNDYLVTKEMSKMAGKIVTIASGNHDHYNLEEVGWNWTDEMLEEVEKVSKSMHAYDLMKLAAENPQKYEGKKYKVVAGFAKGYNGSIDEFIINPVGEFSTGRYLVSISSGCMVDEIIEDKEVSFEEARKAHAEGRRIIAKFPDFRSKTHLCAVEFWKEQDGSDNSKDLAGNCYRADDNCLTFYVVNNARWFIKGGE